MVDALPLTYHTEAAAAPPENDRREIELRKSNNNLTVSKEISNEFKHSYGVWTVMASFLQKKHFLSLQALNTYFYKVCIGRVQTRLAVSVPTFFVGVGKHQNVHALDPMTHELTHYSIKDVK